MNSFLKTLYQSKFLTLTSFVVLLLFTACGGDDGNGTTPPAELNPEISGIQPESGPPGTSVTISGSDFSPTASENTVTFADLEAEVTDASSSELVATVPDSAESGAVAVTVDGNTATGPNFTVEAEAPVINSIEPDSGTVGTEVTINGLNFSPTVAENSITFNGTEATISSATDTTLVTTVPEGATSGSVTVTVNGESTNGLDFTVLSDAPAAPAINSIEPDSGSVGTEVTINGSNFSATASENTVAFNGTAATVSSATDTTLVTAVPEGATTGPVEVTVNGETASSGSNFTVTTDDGNNEGGNSIAATIQSDEELSILAGHLSGTDLEATLDGEGPYTILAPTNAALANMPNYNPQQLQEILSYHVISENRASADFQQNGNSMVTLQGDSIFVVSGQINHLASISSADIEATNGTIHKVDNLLLPDGYTNVFSITYKRPVTNKFACTCVSGEGRTDLGQILRDPNSTFTVFVPSDAAFSNRETSVDDLTDAELQSLMDYHVIEDEALTSGNLSDGQTLTTRNGAELTVSIADDGTISLNGGEATVQTADLEGRNGVVHIIDTVMEPPADGS